MSSKTVVYLHHAPVVLRVDEMVDGEVGKIAKFVGEIPLVTGRNEVDPDLWAAWLASNKDGPFRANGIIKLENEEHGEDTE